MGRRVNKKGVTGVAAFIQLMSATEEKEPVQTGTVRSQTSDFQSTQKASKRRKIGLLDSKWEKHDATGLVTRYKTDSEVPEHLKKYFFQRERYFSLYDKGCLLDEEGWYSVTPEKMADHIAERCRCDTILDAFCGVGGNTIAFAKTCHRVIALDTSPVRLALARHNAIIYGVVDRIEFVLADFLDFSRSYLARPQRENGRMIDVVFLSPPWGGPSYIYGSPSKSSSSTNLVTAVEDEDTSAAHPEYSLQSILPIPGDELFHLSRRITKNIAYLLPRTTRLAEISNLVPGHRSRSPSLPDMTGVEGRSNVDEEGEEQIEIEEEYMGNKLKALTCYFGGLVAGQETQF